MTLDELVRETDGMDPWKRRAMCASAVERIAPIFRRFGRAGSLPAFEGALEAFWTAVASGRPRPPRRALTRLPETRADDSHTRAYYAGRALLILFRALDCLSGTRNAGGCLDEMASICDDFDTLLTAAPGQTFRYDPQNPPPPGEIETAELRAQGEVLRLLRDAAAPDAALIESLRRRARGDAAVYDKVSTLLRLS
jgi:hypothetical protein